MRLRARARRQRGVALAAAALLAAAGAAAVPPGAPPRAGGTSLLFSAEILADLGVELVDVAESSAPLRDGALGFAVDAARSTLAPDATGEDFEGFAAADLRHAG